MDPSSRFCWKRGENIKATGPALEVHRSKGSRGLPERLLRLCEKCWDPIKSYLERADYKLDADAGTRSCWNCSKGFELGDLRFDIYRFGLAYNKPYRLLRLCQSCWTPVSLHMEEAGYVIQAAHATSWPVRARKGALVVNRPSAQSSKVGEDY